MKIPGWFAFVCAMLGIVAGYALGRHEGRLIEEGRTIGAIERAEKSGFHSGVAQAARDMRSAEVRLRLVVVDGALLVANDSPLTLLLRVAAPDPITMGGEPIPVTPAGFWVFSPHASAEPLYRAEREFR